MEQHDRHEMDELRSLAEENREAIERIKEEIERLQLLLALEERDRKRLDKRP